MWLKPHRSQRLVLWWKQDWHFECFLKFARLWSQDGTYIWAGNFSLGYPAKTGHCEVGQAKGYIERVVGWESNYKDASYLDVFIRREVTMGNGHPIVESDWAEAGSLLCLTTGRYRQSWRDFQASYFLKGVGSHRFHGWDLVFGPVLYRQVIWCLWCYEISCKFPFCISSHTCIFLVIFKWNPHHQT